MSYHIVKSPGWGGPYGITRIGATETETVGSKLKGWLIAAGLIGIALIAMKATNRKKRRNPRKKRGLPRKKRRQRLKYVVYYVAGPSQGRRRLAGKAFRSKRAAEAFAKGRDRAKIVSSYL